jgi:hypothetical protein
VILFDINVLHPNHKLEADCIAQLLAFSASEKLPLEGPNESLYALAV